MKLQFKLTLYNTLTKLAIIFFSGIIILFSLEQITYHHTSLRLEDKKNEFLKHLSPAFINRTLDQQKTYTDYNILKDDYIRLKQVPFKHIKTVVNTFSTSQRTIDNSTDTYRILSCVFNYRNQTYQLEVGNTMDAVEELKGTIKGFTLIILFVALSLTLITDLVFTKYLLNPLYKIIDKKLIKVNDPLNFNYEKIATTTDDFKLLDDSISSLMTKITSMFMLEKQFIANVSHELLTPISIISSRLENVLLHETLTEDAENKIFASLKTLNRLKSIINSLLLISQVENNQFNKNDVVKITDIIDEIAEELEDRLDDKAIKLNNQLKYQPAIVGNRTLMHTLLFNIINNAIKYNYENGMINITDQIEGLHYQLNIQDTGIGMDSEQIDKAFNRFEKLDNNDEKESFGLGLAIVKSISAFHDIKISINSKKDIGTTLTLVFNDQPQLH